MANEERRMDNKWWEFYFVRYFVGTVVGGAILLYLNVDKNSGLVGLIIPGVADVGQLDPQKLLLLLAMGLAYCYLASVPVLVFHATRGVFLGLEGRAYRNCVRALLLTAIIVGVILAYRHESRGFSLVVVLFMLVLGIQVILLGFAISRKGELTYRYYLALVRARSQDSGIARQYVESYKHLREHGNAFFILIFEVVLGVFLSVAPTPNWALIALIFWTLPGAFVWVVGTQLERRLAARDSPF